MRAQLFDMGGQGQPLVFAHANGFPPNSYRQLFSALSSSAQLLALEHRPLWGDREPPAALHWSLFAEDLLGLLRREFSEPVWVMGHSLGGTTALLAADREPQLIAGLILLDPVLLTDRQLLPLRLMSERQRRRLPMVRSALGRPEHFASFDEAFQFYRSKRAFSGLDDDALWDYVRASKSPESGGGVRLRYPAAWEAAIYQTAPKIKPSIKRLRLPTLGLRGRDSDTLSTSVFRRWRRWQPAATLRECPGGHLFPMEKPRATAELVELFLREQCA